MKFPSLTITQIPTMIGTVAICYVGFSVTLLRSQFAFVLNFLIWKLELYWVFKKYEPIGPLLKDKYTHLNGVEIASMTHEELVTTVQAMGKEIMRLKQYEAYR